MTDSTARALSNIAICLAVVAVAYFTKTPWALLGLIFIAYKGPE